MSVFVGLDCGGSSSRVLAVDSEGSILFQGHSGAANLVSTPESRLRRNLIHATRGCPQPKFVCGCFAGLINDDVRQRGVLHLREIFPSAAAIRAEPDYTAAFYACPTETDICVIAGTGSLVCSRGRDGMNKSGGRGFLLGDEGSAYHFGRDALMHYLQHPLTCTETLRGAVLELFGTLDETPIVAIVYRSGAPAPLLAKLARALGQDARAGEQYAVSSILHNSGQLAEIVSQHVRRYLLGRETLSISLAGGLWKASPSFREMFGGLLAQKLPEIDLRVMRIARPPLHGAVELAKEMNIVAN